MQRSIPVVLLALVAACTGPAAEPSTTTTTQPPTTTTTVDPAQIAGDTCDALKIASFDVGTDLRNSLEGVDPLSSEVDDAEIGAVVVGALVDFYDQVGAISADAPADVAAALRTVADAVDPWRDALAESEADLAAALEQLDPETIVTPEVRIAIDALNTWTEEACGAVIPLDVEEVVLTTVFAAIMGAFGSALGGFGGDFLDFGDDTEDGYAVAFGDDPRLDALFTRCGAGDGAACTDLYYSAFGEYELWGQTCGASIPLRRAWAVDCETKFSSTAHAYGDDFVLDSLWDQCQGGDQESCDGLYAAAPFGSVYETFGAGCADTRPVDGHDRPCVFTASGEPFGFGDDAEFDRLWGACAGGDGGACSDLFLLTPIGSAYEAFGRVCGDLLEEERSCANAAQWLGAPQS